LNQQQIAFDAKFEKTLSTLSSTNDILKMELDDLKKQLVDLTEENNQLK
jgi:regulator of replication initiation timing